MIFWTILNIATALIVSAIVVYMLFAYHDRFSLYVRLAMGMVASGMILRIGPLLGKNLLNVESPFDNWSTTFLHVGVAALFICWFWDIEKGGSGYKVERP